MAAIDERQVYGSGIELGNVGFSFTPEGRGFLLSQLTAYNTPERRLVGGDYVASMLLDAGVGEAVMPEEIGEDGVIVLGENDALIRRGDPWSWCLSAYTAEVSDSRWIQDRHNLVDLFHSSWVCRGGGNTKLQPYWSYSCGRSLTHCTLRRRIRLHPTGSPAVDAHRRHGRRLGAPHAQVSLPP